MSQIEEEVEHLYLLEVIVDYLEVFKEGIQSAFEIPKPPPEEVKGELDIENGEEEQEEKKPSEVPKEVKPPVRVKVKFMNLPSIEIEESEFKNNPDAQSSDGNNNDSSEDNGSDFPEKVQQSLREKQEEERWRAKKQGLTYESWKKKSPELAVEVQGSVPVGNRFTSGKSCLFPMVPKDMINVMKTTPLIVEVHRDKSETEPAHMIGQEKIYLGEEFVEVVALASTPVILPVSAIIEDNFVLKNVFGEVTANAGFMIRLSCFGSTIFTQFKYIHGDKGFQFKTTQGTSQAMPVQPTPVETVQQETADEQKFEPYFAEVENITLGFEDGPCEDVFKLPVPWRKLTDEPPNVQICSPQTLFKFQNSDDKYSCGLQEMMNFRQGASTSGSSNPCASMPPPFGNAIPPQIRDMKPKGVPRGGGRGPLDIPPGTKLPCQFGANWINDSQLSPNMTDSMTIKCPVNANYGQPSYPATSQAPNYCKSPDTTELTNKSNKIWLLDHPTPPISTFPSVTYSTTEEGYKKHFPGHANAPFFQKTPMFNMCGPQIPAGPPIPGEDAAHVDGVPCPYQKEDNGNMNENCVPLCGLSALFDPDQRYLDNALNNPYYAPPCPPDSNANTTSICTCPKVPNVLPETQPGYIKCECTNILTSLKPIDMPYSCPEPLPSEIVKPCNPATMPTRVQIPTKPPECPLAKLLQEAEQLKCGGRSSKQPPQAQQNSQMPRYPRGGDSAKNKDTEETESERPKKADDKTISDNSQSPGQSGLESSGTKPGKNRANNMLKEELAYYEEVMGEIENVSPPKTMANPAPSDQSRNQNSPQNDQSYGRQRTPSMPGFIKDKPGEIAYTYTAGMYPGMVVGHKDCIPVYQMVPKNMGWLWNTFDANGYLKPARGWRPGAIQSNVIKVIEGVRKNTKDKKYLHSATKMKSQKGSSRKGKTAVQKAAENSETKHEGAGDGQGDINNGPLEVNPTLHLHKKHGMYYVSMFPAKKTKRLKTNEKGEIVMETSEDERPVQFRIDPKDPDGTNGAGGDYDSNSSTTITDDSFEMEFMSPKALEQRIPPKIKKDNQIQVIEEELEPEVLPPVKEHKPKKKGKKKGKK